jgi:hypothetical protein
LVKVFGYPIDSQSMQICEPLIVGVFVAFNPALIPPINGGMGGGFGVAGTTNEALQDGQLNSCPSMPPSNSID